MTFIAKLRPGLAGAGLLAILVIAAPGAPEALAADTACPGGKVKYYRNPIEPLTPHRCRRRTP